MCPTRLRKLVGGGYDAYWHCTARYRVLKGGKASKKSSVTAINFIYRLMKYPESNLLVIRAVMNTHKHSTFAQLVWAQEKLGVAHLWNNQPGLPEMTYRPTGQKILFRGCDDVTKLASVTVPHGVLNFVWIEEAFELSDEEDFNKLDLTVPRGRVPDGLFKQTTLTFNPWSREHWLKARFFDEPKEDVAAFTTDYTCNEFLDETDRAVFRRMKEHDPAGYAVAGLGQWGVAAGRVFDNWRVEERPVWRDDPGEWKAFFGLDYGYTNDPTAFIGFYANPEKRLVYIFTEFCQTGMLNSDIAERIRSMGFAKERIRADSAEPKSNEDLRRMGIRRLLPSVKGPDSVLAGIARIKEYTLLVDPACRSTLAELEGYVWGTRTNAKGQRLPADSDNHLMDAMRYAFFDVPYFKGGQEKTAGRTVWQKTFC